MPKIVVYVLCYDDASEAKAREEYVAHHWARILRLGGSKYMEGQVFIDVLDSLRSEWEDADFVGTLSWRASEKITVPDIEILCEKYKNASAISLLFLPEITLGRSTLSHPRFLQVWIPMLTEMGHSVQDAVSHEFLHLVGNYWLAKPHVMTRFCQFFKSAVRVLETKESLREALWSDACYDTHLTKERCMEIYDKPYMPYHSFVCERLAGFFFWKHSIPFIAEIDTSRMFWVKQYGPEVADNFLKKMKVGS